MATGKGRTGGNPNPNRLTLTLNGAGERAGGAGLPGALPRPLLEGAEHRPRHAHVLDPAAANARTALHAAMEWAATVRNLGSGLEAGDEAYAICAVDSKAIGANVWRGRGGACSTAGPRR